MKVGLTSSIFTHVAVILLAQFGLPGMCSKTELVAEIVPVDLLTAAQAEAMMRPVEDIPETPDDPVPPQPKPEEVVEIQEPEPPELAEPEPVIEEDISEPEPVPEPPAPDEVILAAAPDEPDEEIVETTPPPDILPDRRPPPPEIIEVAEVPEQGSDDPTQDCDPKDFICNLAAEDPEEVAAAPDTQEVVVPAGLPSAARQSQLDRIRRLIIDQVSACWAPLTGAVMAEDLVVKIRVRLNVDGGVENVNIVDRSRMGERYFRAASEAAMRAILNPDCNPLNLPLDQYADWNDLIITFNPAEMLN